MKKTTLITVLLCILTPFNVFAKTEGNYLSINLVNSSVDAEYLTEDPTYNGGMPGPLLITNSNTDNKANIGLSYQYAFNFSRFFIAPGLFYDKVGSETEHNVNGTYAYNGFTLGSTKLELEDIYGVKFNLGYDFTNKFAAFIPLTYSNISYKSTHIATTGDSETKSGNEKTWSVGLGTSYRVSNKVTFNLEYNTFYRAKLGSSLIYADTRVDNVKIGVSYNF